MKNTLYISATLRIFAEHKAEVEVEGNTVREALNDLREKYPECEKIFEDNGNIKPFVSVFVNERRVHNDADLKEGDRILLLPVIAGGAPSNSVISDERRKAVTLDDKEIERYNKHLMLRDIGVKGQKRIKAAKVLIIGLGALGTPVVQYLAAAGVGMLGIADFDEVSLGNLQSQVIHTTKDVNRPKTASARDKIKAVNPNVKIETINERITADNIAGIIDGYDVIVDCTDNYQSRYLINDACVLCKKPLVFGAIYQFEGQVSVFDVQNGSPCFRCQFPAPPPAGLVPTCSAGGTTSPLSGIIGSIQANEVLKLLIGGGETLTGRLLFMDTWNLHTSVLNICKDENCPVCGKSPSITEITEFDYEDFCGLKPCEEENSVETIDPAELKARMDSGEPLTIIDIREPHERAIRRFPNAIVIPIGQLVRRQKELDANIDTVFICTEGKRSILAINTLKDAGYTGRMLSLSGGVNAAKEIFFSNEKA